MTATFIPVEDIEADFEATALSGVPLALTAAVKPDYATNRAVGWSIVSSGTTNASLAGNVLTASDGGTVTVRGTIINGVSQDPQVHFVKTFDIDVLKTATPAVLQDTVEKPSDTAGVSFTLTNTFESGTAGKAYASAEGAAPVPGIGVAVSGSTLTISHTSDVPAGIYYVTATEPGKGESDRVALTVLGAYSVTYHLNGGALAGSAGEETVTDTYTWDGQSFTFPAPSRAGYVFLGWCEDSAADGLNGTGLFTLPQDPPGGGAELWAAWAVNVGSPASSGEGWSYAGGVITIQDGADVVFTGSTTANRLAAASGAIATVKLKNVSVSLASGTPFSGPAASVTLLLEGNNSLTVTNTGGAYGISVTWLTVDSAASVNAGTDSSSRSTEGALYVNAGNSGGGAGISGSVTVLGGVVRAGSYYAFERTLTARGGVVFAQNTINTLTRPADSTAVVFVNTAPSGWDDTDHGDLVACGGEAAVSGGAVTLNAPLTIPSGVTLRIPAGVTFTIPSGSALTIASGGTLIVDGAVVISGTLQNGGAVINRGTITGDVTGGGSVAHPVEIRYHLNGGSLNGSAGEIVEQLTSSAQYTLPAPSFGGRAFLGWYDNAQFTGSPVTAIPSGSSGIKEFWALWQSATPSVSSPSVTKTLDTAMTAVPFALTQPLSGTWTVYAAASGDAPAEGVTASSSGGTLTLHHGSDVPWGTYYVSVTEPGKTESLRAALTVIGEYSVTYHLGGVAGPAGTAYQAHALPYTLPVPNPVNKVFMGWYTDGAFTGDEVTEIPAGTLGPAAYWARWEDPPPPIDVGSPGTGGLRWSYAGGVITLQDGANVTLTGATTGEASNRVVVEPGATVTVKLSNVSIIRSANGGSAYTAFYGYNAAVTLLLEGENTVAVNEYYTGGDYAFNVANLTIDSASSVNAGTDASSRSALGTLRASAGGHGSMYGSVDPGAAFGGGITLLGGVVIGESGYENYRAVYSGGNFILKGGVFIASQIIHAEFSRPALSTGIVFAGEWINRYNFDWRGYDGGGYDLSVAQEENNIPGDVIITGDEVTVEGGDAKTITLNAPLTIPAGVTLRIPAGWTLKLNGHTLTIASGGTVLCSSRTGGDVTGDLTGHLESGVITD